MLRISQTLKHLPAPPSIIDQVFTILAVHGLDLSLCSTFGELRANEKVTEYIQGLFPMICQNIEPVTVEFVSKNIAYLTLEHVYDTY